MLKAVRSVLKAVRSVLKAVRSVLKNCAQRRRNVELSRNSINGTQFAFKYRDIQSLDHRIRGSSKPMKISFTRVCPTCGRPMLIRLEMRGNEVACQHCGGTCTAHELEGQTQDNSEHQGFRLGQSSARRTAPQLTD